MEMMTTFSLLMAAMMTLDVSGASHHSIPPAVPEYEEDPPRTPPRRRHIIMPEIDYEEDDLYDPWDPFNGDDGGTGVRQQDIDALPYPPSGLTQAEIDNLPYPPSGRRGPRHVARVLVSFLRPHLLGLYMMMVRTSRSTTLV